MTSLRGSLPPAGSTLWGKERRSSSVESSHGPQSLITHVVIREVWKKELPSPHALYKIDVMTKSNHWFVLKRYREFSILHKKLVSSYGIPRDMLPPKKLTSKMSIKHLERRRDALEHYLQRLVNSSTYVSSSQEILEFLDVGKHDVMSVTKALATELFGKGDKILAEHGSYTFNVTEMYCITRQLQLPEPTQASEEHTPLDLGHLYSFVYQLEDLCVAPSKGSKNTQEFASHLEFDISLFKALKSLKLDGCPVSLVKGLSSLQAQLKYLTVQQTLNNMKELLIDRVVEKRKASSSGGGGAVASWRSHATARLTQDRVIILPWVQLTNLTLSHNSISMFDESMKLLPLLQNLDLSYNDFVSLDLLQLNSPSLTHLDLSHNSIHYISGSPKSVENLKSLVLDGNNLQTLKGLESLVGLIELNIASNQIVNLKEIHCLCGMSQLRYLSVDGNPLTKVKSYRLQIFSIFKGRRIVLDNRSRTDDEKANLDGWPSRSRALTSPQNYDREEPDKVVRLVRSHSYEALGESSHHDDDDDDGINDDDDDSGIDGYTPSVTSVDTIVEGADGSAQEQKEEDLEFNWSYYDFLDMSGNMAFPSLGRKNKREAKDETHKELTSSLMGNDLEEKLGQEHHPNEATLPLNTEELEERIEEEMCQEKTESTSSTEVASEVSVNGDSSQSDCTNIYNDNLQTAGVSDQEDETLPETTTCLPDTSDTSNNCTDNLQAAGVSDQEDETLPGTTTCLPGTSDTSNNCTDNLQTAGVSDQEDETLPGTTTCLPGTSDTSNNCTDNLQTAGVSDQEDEALPGTTTCLPGTSNNCTDNLQTAGVSDQEDEALPGTTTCLPDTSNNCTDNLQTAGVSDQEDEALPGTATCLLGTSDTSNNCTDNLQTTGVSDQEDKETPGTDTSNNCTDNLQTAASDGRNEATSTDNINEKKEERSQES